MKCRYKEPMEYFYLTKDNYEEFLVKFFNLSCDDIIIYGNKDYLKFKLKDGNDDFDYYYLYNHYYILECSKVIIRYTKEEFEEIFEVIG